MDFLLLHGSSHGAWCWEPLIRELAALGHRAHAPDLPGHGRDPTPRAEVTFRSYVEAVNRVLTANPSPEKTVLVGHSLAGIFLPEVAAANRNRVSQAVYLAGVVLDLGERGIDRVPEERRRVYHEQAAASADGTFLLPFETARNVFFEELDDDEARRLYGRLTPQPLAPYLGKATVAPGDTGVPARYILCSRDRVLSRDACIAFAAKLGREPEEIDGGHDAMLSHPRELAALLTG